MNIIGISCKCFALLALIIIKWKRIPVAKDAVKVSPFYKKQNKLEFSSLSSGPS